MAGHNLWIAPKGYYVASPDDGGPQPSTIAIESPWLNAALALRPPSGPPKGPQRVGSRQDLLAAKRTQERRRVPSIEAFSHSLPRNAKSRRGREDWKARPRFGGR